MTRHLIALTGLLSLAAAATEPLIEEEVAESGGMDIAQFIDVLSTRVVYTPGMDFTGLTPGDADYTNASIFALLGLIEFAPDWNWIPAFNYEYSSLDINPAPFGANPAAPRLDNDFHSISFQSFILNTPDDSKWMHGAYLSTGVNSDFSGVSSRDIDLSLAFGSGYQFTDRFILGFGLYGSNLLNDPFIIPAAVFFWMPTDDWLVSYYGPRFIARREFGDSARLGFEAGWNGGWWGAEAFGSKSRVDVDSFRTGLYYRHRIAGEAWLELAAGYTFFNEITINSPGGRNNFPGILGETDPAPYVSVGFNIRRW